MSSLVACLFLAASVPVSALAIPPPVRIAVEGAVHRPGAQQLPSGSRFADAVIAAKPRRDAYVLGASVFRRAELGDQARLRAGLLHDLEAVITATDAPPALAARAQSLRAWIERLPATGRVPIEGNSRRLEASRGDVNRILKDGDLFVLPERPSTVTVVGAVVQPCSLPHVPVLETTGFLDRCPIDREAADADSIHVIQPDGQVLIVGVGAWNRSAAPSLAAGAVIYVPLRERAVARIAPELNRSMSAFLATQPLPHDTWVAP